MEIPIKLSSNLKARPRAVFFLSFVAVGLAPPLMADLGSASSFAILSSSGVTFRNRVIVHPVVIPGTTTCFGAANCIMRVGGTTVLMGRGNSVAPDQVGGDVIASASAAQGINCAGAPPGSTAICFGNLSSVTGACLTGGGSISNPSFCSKGTDTTGNNASVTTLLPKAQADAPAFSASLAPLPH